MLPFASVFDYLTTVFTSQFQFEKTVTLFASTFGYLTTVLSFNGTIKQYIFCCCVWLFDHCVMLPFASVFDYWPTVATSQSELE